VTAANRCDRCGIDADRAPFGEINVVCDEAHPLHGRRVCLNCFERGAPKPEPKSAAPRAPTPDDRSDADLLHDPTEDATSGAETSKVAPLLTAHAPPSSLVPSPSSHAADTESEINPDDEVEWWLAEWAAGRADPEPVELPPLPAKASENVRLVAALYRVLLGLRLGALDERAVPFACGWVGRKLAVLDPLATDRAKRRREPPGPGLPRMTVWRILRRLEADGVLVRRGDSPGRTRNRRPMHLWAPGLLPLEAGAVEAPAEVVCDPVEPEAELADESFVGGTELAAAAGERVSVAAGGGAGSGDDGTGCHGRQPTPAAGQVELLKAPEAAGSGDVYEPTPDEVDRFARSLEEQR
jgi:hypothetical protein